MTAVRATPSPEEIRLRLGVVQERLGRRHAPSTPDQAALARIPAAVLVPIVTRPEGPTILLTRRTEHLSHHPGQVSFPGGRIDPGEEALDSALRETEEEIGLARAHVEIIGRLDQYAVRGRFDVTPFVGLVAPPLALTRCESEVAEIFEVPLAFVLDPANHRERTRLPSGADLLHRVLEYNGHYIWGATAGMLINLYEVLRD